MSPSSEVSMSSASKHLCPTRGAAAVAVLALIAMGCTERAVPFEPDTTAISATTRGNAYVAAPGQERAAEISATRTIGPAGGQITAGEVTLQVPAGALSASTEITMTVPAGRFSHVQLAPHGLEFDAPFTLSLPLHGTQLALAQKGALRAIYFLDALGADGSVNALELLRLELRAGRGTFTSDHFSGYLLGTNRSNSLTEG
jgi:hypothetical protein